MSKQSANSNNPKLIFTCSGAADVGEIADRAGRKLHREGRGKMYCLSGIGTGLSGFVETTKAAEKMLVIDGCPIDCAKKIMEKAGFSKFDFIRVTDHGFEKGKSPASENAIEIISACGEEFLAS
jgi:uncharacterized metal-binding protein